MKNYPELANYDCTPLFLVQLFETQPPEGRGKSFARQFVSKPHGAPHEASGQFSEDKVGSLH